MYLIFFERAIEEIQEVVLFGDSGNDEHINRMIVQISGEKRIRVVE